MEQRIKDARSLGAGRARFWRDELSEACSAEGFLAQHGAAISQLLLEVAGSYTDSATRKAVLAFLREAVKQTVFLKTFAGSLVKVDAAKREGPAVVNLARWIGCVLSALQLPAMKKAFDKLAEIQASLLDRMVALGVDLRVVANIVAKSAAGRGEVLDGYMQQLRAKASSALFHGLWVLHCKKQRSNGDHRAAFVDLFCEQVLSSKVRMTDAWLRSYSAFSAGLTSEELVGKLVPAMSKAMRRTPEPACTAAAALLQHAAPDLSGAAEALQPVLVQMVRHVNASVRQAGVAVIRALSDRLEQPAALQLLLQALTDALDGKAGAAVRQAAERLALLQAVHALCPSKPSVEQAEVCQVAVAWLYADIALEQSDDVRVEVLAAALTWLSGCRQLQPATVQAMADGLLGGKDALRLAHLKCLAAAVLMLPPGTSVTGLRESLVKMISQGLAKATLRPEGVVAMLALSRLAPDGVASDADLAATWQQAASPQSELLSPKTAAKLGDAEACQQAAVLQFLLCRMAGSAMEPENEELTQAVCRGLAQLHLHASKAVRQAAAECAAASVEQVPAAAEQLLLSVKHWMDQFPDVPVLRSAATAQQAAVKRGGEGTVGSDAAGQQQAAAASAQQRALFRHALLSCLPKKHGEAALELDGAAIAAALQASHHRLLMPPRSQCSAPSAACRRMACRAAPLDDERMRGAAERAAARLDQVIGADSVPIADRAACCRGLAAAVALAPHAMYPQMLQTARLLLDAREHDSLTSRELLIWKTQPGTLSMEMDPSLLLQDMLSSEPEASGSNGAPVALKRIGKGSDDALDAKPSAGGVKLARRDSSSADDGATPRGSKAASAKGGKGGKGGKQDKLAAVREAELAEEALVRQRVEALRERLQLGLDLVAAAAHAHRGWVRSCLDELSGLVLPLMRSHLVGGRDSCCYSSMRALAGCIPGALGRKHADHLAQALLVLPAAAAAPSDSATAQNAAVVAAVRCLAVQTASGSGLGGGGLSAAPSRTLPAPSFHLCFPIIHAVLGAPHHTPEHPGALAVLAAHVDSLDTPQLRQRSLLLLYHLLGVVPAFRDDVSSMLRVVYSSLQPEELPVALQGLLSVHANVRGTVLAMAHHLPGLGGAGSLALLDSDVAAHALAALWLSQHDVSDSNSSAALRLWGEVEGQLPPSFVHQLLAHLSHESTDIRSAAAQALAAGLELHAEMVQEALELCLGLYGTLDDPAAHAMRSGCALGLGNLAGRLSSTELVASALQFLLSQGIADEDEEVRGQMVDASIALVERQGKEELPQLMPLVEGYLHNSQGMDEARYDHVRKGAVIMLGTLARHLDPQEPKMKEVLSVLVEVLSTPSESVQTAASNCLSPLAKALSGTDKEFLQQRVEALLTTLTTGSNYGERRGAAYGLAGVVKGLGISALRSYGIMDRLKASIENRKDAKLREGALLAFECLSIKLGKMFEPYVVTILPQLLQCYGDSAAQVREATQDTARAIMGQLTGQGVKLVLPALLKGLEDRQWRTKKGSIQLLSTMSFCAPKQLSSCLPTIVPALGDALSDPHPQVQEAANTALEVVGHTIRNPEIQGLVPPLLKAISQPNQHTRMGLDLLLDTVFVNTIDAASLSLIAPVVHNGLRDRSGDTKKRAARIVGNMCSLVNDPKDMAPYVDMLMPELKSVLVDPLPEVRARAAKALASLLNGMGRDHLLDALPWLMSLLRSEGSSVERTGAAGGLAEVLALPATGQLSVHLPSIIDGCSDRSAAVREGHLTVFRFLPDTCRGRFEEHLGDVLPCILDGVADEAEGVRHAALAAGRVFVEVYAQTSLPLLLPAVEQSLHSANWRIRQSSVALLGALLFKVVGASGKVVLDGEDDSASVATDEHNRAIIAMLGLERRNEVLSGIYMLRSDVSAPVRQESLHVWKTVVHNTPKTLGEILPTLMSVLTRAMASEDEERQLMASRVLGELVRKMGDRVVARVLPILRESAEGEDAAVRLGACLGLKELLDSMTRQQLSDHLSSLLPPIQQGLTDTNSKVREAAGGAFGILFQGGSSSVAESIVPELLVGLESKQRSAEALEGLRVILTVKPQLLGSVVPKLTKPPMKISSIVALGSLAEVAGGSMLRHLPGVLNPLLLLSSAGSSAGSDADGPAAELAAAARTSAEQVALNLPDDAVPTLVNLLIRTLDDAKRRRGVAALIQAWASRTPAEMQEHIGPLMAALVGALAEDDERDLQAAWHALRAVTAKIPQELLPTYVRTLKDAVEAAREKQARKRRQGELLLPGLCLPSALEPVVDIYLKGMLQASSPELREAAAEGLGELVALTQTQALHKHVVKITGLLIRIVGEKFSWEIKLAILTTMGLLISKAGLGLKAFVSQLQITFMKNLASPERQVRCQAAANLGSLSAMSARPDQLATDLTTQAGSADMPLKEGYLQALTGLLRNAGHKLQSTTVSKAVAGLQALHPGCCADEAVRRALACALGALCHRCSSAELAEIVSCIVQGSRSDPGDQHLAAMLVACIAQDVPLPRLEEEGMLQPLADAAVLHSRSSSDDCRIAATRAAGRLISKALQEGGCGKAAPLMRKLLPVMVAATGPDQNPEVHSEALSTLKAIARAHAAAFKPMLVDWLPLVWGMLQSMPAGPSKMEAERMLGTVLQIQAGVDSVKEALVACGITGSVKAGLSEAYLRRLSQLGPANLAAEEEDF